MWLGMGSDRRVSVRALILGTDGMVGRTLFRALRARLPEADVLGTTRTRSLGEGSDDGLLPLPECRDSARLVRILEQVKPSSVVNCIGLLSGLADPARTIEVNAVFPRRLAEFCDQLGTRVVQISTDAVFSGRNGPYDEDAVPDPIDDYGRSKLLGELYEGEHLTVRTSVIGLSPARRGLVDWAISQRGSEVQGYSRCLWSGVTDMELARLLEPTICGTESAGGVVHVSAEAVSKAELLERISDALDLGLRVRPVNEPVMDRRLLTRRHELELRARPLDEQLRELATAVTGGT